MRSSTGAQDTAILAKFRDVSLSVSVNGSTTLWPVTEFKTDAQMKDTPDQISLMGGVAARSVSFNIDHTKASAITPYQASIVPAALPLPIGAPVVISVSFWPSTSRTGTATYTATIFTGNVIGIDSIDGTGNISVTAQDVSYSLGSLVSLPAASAAGAATVNLSSDFNYSSLVVIDLCLRACGQYLTAPPVLTGANRTNYTILSVPGYGGNIPDVGGVHNSFIRSASRSTGVFSPDVIGVDQADYLLSRSLAGVLDYQLFKIDTWVKSNLGDILFLVSSGLSVLLTAPGGQVQVITGSINYTAPTPNVADNAWHHLVVEMTAAVGGVLTGNVWVDGTKYVIPAGTWSAALGSDNLFIVGINEYPGFSSTVFTEALEVILVPTGATFSNPAPRNGQAAGITSSVTATSARLGALAPQVNLNAWQTIQSVAAAEGALCWFDEDGKFFFEPRVTWLARRTAASVRTFDASSVADFSMSVHADGLRKTVSANYSTVTAIASTAAAPAYVGDTVLNFSTGLTTTAIQTSQLFFNPSAAAIGASNAVGNSWFYPVAASSVGDPAAALVGGVQIAIAPTATGFNLTVRNPYRYPIAFWNPTAGTIPQGPAIVIHGTKIITSDPITVSYAGNITATDDLQLDDNPWRRDGAITQQMVYTAAMDCYDIIPVFSDIDVPGDPRIQLGDIVTLLDGRPNSVILTSGGVPCVVVDIQHNYSGGQYRMTLGVRPIGPPTGLLAGVTGRSEAGTTTYAPLP